MHKCHLNTLCHSLFSLALTQYHRLDNLQRKRVYLDVVRWEVHMAPASDENLPAVLSHGRVPHMVRQPAARESSLFIT